MTKKETQLLREMRDNVDLGLEYLVHNEHQSYSFKVNVYKQIIKTLKSDLNKLLQSVNREEICNRLKEK